MRERRCQGERQRQWCEHSCFHHDAAAEHERQHPFSSSGQRLPVGLAAISWLNTFVHGPSLRPEIRLVVRGQRGLCSQSVRAVKKKGRDRSGSRLATQQSSRILMLRGCTFLQRPLQSNSFMDDDACRVPQQPHWQEIMCDRLHGHRGDGLSKLNEITKPSSYCFDLADET